MSTDSPAECPYCRGFHNVQITETQSRDCGSFSLRHCDTCSGYFLSPSPSDEILRKAYDSSYYGGGGKKFNFGISAVIDFFRRHRVSQIVRYLPPGSKVLDVGCGDGAFLKCFIERGHNGFGVELDGPAAKRASAVKNLNLHVGEFTSVAFPPAHFDLISLCHVFEHLRNPKETLQLAERCLKDGGHLLISLPNIESAQAKLYRGDWFHLDPPRHLFFFDRNTLLRELQQLGFTLVEEKHFSLIFDPFGFQQSALNVFCKKRDTFYEYLKGNREATESISVPALVIQAGFCALSLPLFLTWSICDALRKKGATMEMLLRKGAAADSQNDIGAHDGI